MPPSSESFGLLAEFNVKKFQKLSMGMYFVCMYKFQRLQIYHFRQMLDDGEKKSNNHNKIK